MRRYAAWMSVPVAACVVGNAEVFDAFGVVPIAVVCDC